MPNITTLERIRFHGVADNKNVSGLAFWRGNALVVTDERVDHDRNVLQILAPQGSDFRAMPGGLIELGRGDEMDLEGVAVDGDTVYVLGSHSWRRKLTKPPATDAHLRAPLLGPPEAQPGRDVLFRISLSQPGKPGHIAGTSLRKLLDTSEPFASFSKIASKENGIDAEGLAIWKGQLYVGFRGPVLRDNFACILRCKFGKPVQSPKILFVNLAGRGIRDLAHVKHGLLILAGPIGDGPESYQLYFWNGNDGVAGNDQDLTLLGELPALKSKGNDRTLAKAEGLALELEGKSHWDVLVVYDGLKDGHGIRLRIAKPR